MQNWLLLLSKYQVNHTDLQVIGVERNNIMVWNGQGKLVKMVHPEGLPISRKKEFLVVLYGFGRAEQTSMTRWGLQMKGERVGFSLPPEDLCVFHAEYTAWNVFHSIP